MKRLLLWLARLPFTGRLVGWLIAHFARILPLRIVAEDAKCIAFHHPLPSYSLHLLVMLRSPARDVSCLSAAQLKQILLFARAVIRKLGLSAPHIMLWTNGGRFQEVRQLHFHLFPSESDREDGLREMRSLRIGDAHIRECVRSGNEKASLLIVTGGTEAFAAALPRLIGEYCLESCGYSVFWDLSGQTQRTDRIYIRMG